MEKRHRSYHKSGLELRTADGVKGEGIETGGLPIVHGLAAPFNKPSELLYGICHEIVAPGYFDSVLQSLDLDVRVIDCHQSQVRIARFCPAKGIKTLRLWTEEDGLHVEFQPVNNSVGRDLIEDIRHGNVDGMSIGHWVADADDADGMIINGYPVRRLLRCKKIDDVSIATYPAYPDTALELRSKAANEMTKEDYAALLSTRSGGIETRKRKLQLLELDTISG